MFSFTVYGVAQPQGSMRAFLPKGSKRPIVTSDNKKLKPWRQEVAAAAIAATREFKWLPVARPGAVGIKACFYFQRPKSAKTPAKTTKPDCDKLLRGLLDALTGIVYEDDAQVQYVEVSKLWADVPRTEVEVS